MLLLCCRADQAVKQVLSSQSKIVGTHKTTSPFCRNGLLLVCSSFSLPFLQLPKLHQYICMRSLRSKKLVRSRGEKWTAVQRPLLLPLLYSNAALQSDIFSSDLLNFFFLYAQQIL